ncbi:cytochrome P450 [Saccharopolyspora taberi]|uniref:Cytochrome P450 n=1 Tax=Saccharopolyspora taberi TaxID=60895 RepID=A0ABN3VHB8_9PSEU
MLFDPFSEEFIADPFPAYRALREQGPVCYHEPTGTWLVGRYEDVKRLLRDHRLVAAHRGGSLSAPGAPPGLQESLDQLLAGCPTVRPEQADRSMKLVRHAFSAPQVAALRSRWERVAEELVDGLVRAGGGDLMAGVTRPLALTVMSDLIGVPRDDRERVGRWASLITACFGIGPQVDTALAVSTSAEFTDYMLELVAHRRTAPENDLLSALADAERGGGLPDQEIASAAAMLLVFSVTCPNLSNAIGFLTLHRHPDQWALLRRKPELMPTAVQELLRFDASVHKFDRTAREDIAVGDARIARGAQVGILFASANHDPARFTEPDRLDINRSPNPHLAFGAGRHHCPGAHLASVQMSAVYSALIRKAPNCRVIAEPQWDDAAGIRGPRELSVAA